MQSDVQLFQNVSKEVKYEFFDGFVEKEYCKACSDYGGDFAVFPLCTAFSCAFCTGVSFRTHLSSYFKKAS